MTKKKLPGYRKIMKIVGFTLETLLAALAGFNIISSLPEYSQKAKRISSEEWFVALTFFLAIYSSCKSVVMSTGIATGLVMYLK